MVIHLCQLCDGAVVQLLGDLIFRIVFFIKTQRSIGTISGKHIASGVVGIAGAVDFISKGFQLFENDLAVFCLQVSIGAFRRLVDHACDDLCQILQCIFRHVQPALRIGDILAVILGHFRNITAQTQNSVESASQAKAMVELQTKAVEEVIAVFREMQARMGQLIEGLKDIAASTEKADGERSAAVAAVKNISDIIEETAGSAETVNDVANKLLEHVEKLSNTASVLDENMEGLKNEISVFKI